MVTIPDAIQRQIDQGNNLVIARQSSGHYLVYFENESLPMAGDETLQLALGTMNALLTGEHEM